MEIKLVLVGAGGTFSTMISRYGNDMLGYFASPAEKAKVASSGRPSDGSVLVLARRTPLQLEMIPEKLLTATALFKIRTPMKEEQIMALNKRPDVISRIAALRENPGPSLKVMHMKDMPAEVIGQDREHWAPSLGKTGFYSVSQRTTGRFVFEHYLAVHAPVERLTTELTALAKRKAFKPTAEHYTIGQFAESMQYRFAKDLAMRNVTFLAKEIASILGIEIELVEDRIALQQLNLNTGSATHQLTAKPVGISLFGHLLPTEYTGNTPSPVYPAVAIYTDCCHPGYGQDTPVAPLNPIDGMVWIPGFKANYTCSEQLNPAMIGMTVPCGSGHETGSKELDLSTTLYVDFCLGSLAGEKITPTHPKIMRNYRSPERILEHLEKVYPQGSPVVLPHLFTTV